MSDTAKPPVITQPNQSGTGRPEYSDEQYQLWLDDMAPFLKQGSSLYYAIEKSALSTHYNSIYRKYRQNDWFCQKIDRYRAYVGELVNMVGYKTIQAIHSRMIESDGKVGILSSEELQVWKTMAEKHRTSQPFFVTRVENAEADDTKLGKIIDTLEQTDYDELAKQAEEQMVAANPLVQNQEQVGAVGDIPAEPDATTASN